MKTFIIATILLQATLVMASDESEGLCEYPKIMKSDYHEKIRFDTKLKRLTESTNNMGIVFEQREDAIDQISEDCLACHDGQLAKGNVSFKERHNFGASHPVGVDYNSISYRKSGYRNIHSINPAIKFVDGRVSCISCHNLGNDGRYHLAMSNTGSKLCFQCHIK